MVKSSLIFGGQGFIGSHLAKHLVGSGNYTRVICADIAAEPRFRVDGAEYVRCDVREPIPDSLGAGITELYNLAAVHTTPGHPEHEYYETNVAGATQITAFARRNGIRDIVFTSSISVYGPSEETKTEENRPAPTSAYGWSKWLAEGIHRAWLEEVDDRRLVTVRPAVIFGPQERGNFTRMAKLLRNGFFIYPGRTNTVKACFYVDDLIEAIGFARARPENYVLFNACYPDRYTIQQIVETMRAVHFSGAKTIVFPKLPLMILAKLMQPLSGGTIHPERVVKLVRSTDILPGWLAAQNFAKSGALSTAIERWMKATGGRFD